MTRLSIRFVPQFACLMVMLCCGSSVVQADTKAAAKANRSIVGKGVRVEFDDQRGTWNAWSTPAKGKDQAEALMLSEMQFGSKDFDSTDAGYTHQVKRSEFEDKLGKGQSLMVHSRSSTNQPTLILELSAYEDRSFITARGGMQNTTSEPLQLMRFVAGQGTLFPEETEFADLAILTGGSGANQTQIVRDTALVSNNNALATYSNGKQRHSAMLGGLTYVDFEKRATLHRHPGTGQLQVQLAAYDEVGKRIDPGKTYVMDDLLYFDFSRNCPFESAEQYGRAMRTAMDVKINYYTFPSICMWFISVKHFGGDSNSVNDTPGAVREMDKIVDSGFLKYSPVAVRLVPDNYEANNQQGWWDDKHWQMYGRKERCIVEGGHYKAPYETTAKWCRAIKQRGGIPFTYFQPGVRSEDYAEAFPEHMLFNEPHRHLLGPDGQPFVERHAIRGGIYGIEFKESYDYTDPGFLKHMNKVYANLASGGIQGIFYDYPTRALPARGGMEDEYSTAAAAYRTVYRLAREPLGPVCYLQERLAWGSDLATGLIDSQRTEGDTNVLTQKSMTKAGLRWYKNRNIVSYDMDGKALIAKGPKQEIPIEQEERRAILTMNYAVSARLLLTESFALMSPEVLHDLSRTIPYHDTSLSARPLDAFLREYPRVYSFRINNDCQQLFLYNDDLEKPTAIEVPLSGSAVDGALSLAPEESYYTYDFWNDCFVGKLAGSETLNQQLRPGEARVLSIHKVREHPQWIATDRHVMQGYVDFEKRPTWNDKHATLQGTSRLVKDEPYRVIVALNGRKADSATVVGAYEAGVTAELKPHAVDANLVVLQLHSKQGGECPWTIQFE